MNPGSSLADLSLDELYAHLAGETAAGSLPLDPDHRRQIGISVFNGFVATVKKELCAADLQLSDNPDRETAIRDAAAITDLLLSLTNRAPLATFAFIIVRVGLRRICRSD